MESREVGVAAKVGCVCVEVREQEGRGVAETEEGEPVRLPSRVHLPLGEPGTAAGHLWRRAVHLMSVFM